MPFPLPQDEELARQLQMELNAMSDVQERGEGVTVPLHGDTQSILTVSHLNWEYSDLGLKKCLLSIHSYSPSFSLYTTSTG